MFNTTHIGGGSHYHQHEVTENRAPTDESVRLLREMEGAAEKRVIERGKLENNSMEGRWTLMARPQDGDVADLHLWFLLNGVEKRVKIEVRLHHYQHPKARMEHIYAKFTIALAEELFKGLLSSPVVKDLFPERRLH